MKKVVAFIAFVAFIVLFLIYQILFIFHWQALLTYFSCCYLVNRFGALLSLSICQFPLGGFKVKVLAVFLHTTQLIVYLYEWSLGLIVLIRNPAEVGGLDIWCLSDHDLYIHISSPTLWVSFSLFRSLEIMWISKRLRSNFLKGSSTWKPDG